MKFFVGLPVAAGSILNDGIEQVLDHMEWARVNAVIVNAQDPAGSYYRFHEDQFAFTRLKPFTPAGLTYDGADVLGIACDEAAKRGMKVYSHTMAYESAWPNYWPSKAGADISGHLLKNFTDCMQVDLFGRKNFRPCINNPDYRQFYLSSVRDQLQSYPIEGINFNMERNGPLSHVLVGHYAATFRYRKPLAPICFCPDCLALARDRGINIDRARQGWLELLEFSERSWRQARKEGDEFTGEGPALGTRTEDTTPPDGYFITFLRLIMRWPEILQWNQMWYDSVYRFYADIYSTAKLVSPERKVGFHIWHHRAFSIFERASYDYGELRRYCDWIKPKMDHTCAGFRFQNDVRRYTQALFYGMDQEKAYQTWCALLGWEHEVPFDELPEAGMSLDYLRRDTASAVAAVRGEVPIYPGIGLDMPSPKRPTEPEYVRSGLHAIYEAGAQGVVLSRGYNEMREKNLKAAGEAIDEINEDIGRSSEAGK